MNTKPNNWPFELTGPIKGLALATGVLIVCFSWPLFALVRFSLGSELYSHIVLIPFISAYLVWLKRGSLADRSAPDRVFSAFSLAGGVAALAYFGLAVLLSPPLARDDSLALTTSSFVLIFCGLCGHHLGSQTLRALAFPLGFLLLMVPFPTIVVTGIESFLQHGSAYVAGVLFNLSGTPVFRQELVFQLPGIRIEVAPECSGIHSSLALFITSLLAGYFFLRSPVSRTALSLAVIPLALLRNGFRVFTIGELCVRISPDMIHSYIHRKGGPIFFALSLIPFCLLLVGLMKAEGARQRQGSRP